MRSLIIILSLLLASCQHFEQDAAEIDSIGDKYYGNSKTISHYKKKAKLPPKPEILPSKIVKNFADEKALSDAKPVLVNNKVENDENGVFFYHHVSYGETVYMLSRKYKMNPKKIILNNNLQEPYELVEGTTIKIHSPKFLPKSEPVVKQASYTSPPKSTPVNYTEVSAANIESHEEEIATMHKPDQPVCKPVPETSKQEKRVTKQVSLNDKKFIWPVNGKVTSKFGPQSSGIKNDGIFIAAPKGASVVATKSGEVVYAGNDIEDFGNMVIVKHGTNTFTTYAHLNEIAVAKGSKVSQGDELGSVGSTGNVKNSGLYFSMRQGKKLLNPNKLLD